MAKKAPTTVAREETPKKKRPGIHSKKRTSKLKKSKNYKKAYKGQGR